MSQKIFWNDYQIEIESLRIFQKNSIFDYMKINANDGVWTRDVISKTPPIADADQPISW